ncbi:MAG: MATE family efflux transporter [Clostridia bacterium]|nr:MATE family efflux transporter [Clostridia bacterium]
MQQAQDQEKQTKKFITMTQTPVKKLILKLAVPTMVSMMITSIYNMADTFFVGQISGSEATSATAAVGVAFPLMAIIQAFGFMFGHGSGNYISRALGKQEVGDAEKIAATGFFMALLAGLLLTILGLVFLEPLAILLGSTQTILPHAKSYISLILIGCPWMTASLVLNNQLRFQGNALFSMIGIASGGLLNIALDPLLIFGLDLGIRGAALATIISQFVSFSLLFIGTWKSDNLKIRFRNFNPRPRFLWEMFKGGAPSLFRQGIGSVATTCLNNAAAVFGDPAIAAMSIVSRVMMFANSLVIGFGQGFQPVCGFNYGAKKYGRVREGYRFCVKYSVLFLLCAAVAGEIFAPQLISLFRRDDADVIRIGALAMRLQCIMLPSFGFQVISSMMLQTSAQTLRASVLALARQGLFFLPLVLILPPMMGLLGIQLAQPISDVISFIVALVVVSDSLKKIKALDLEQQELEQEKA